MRFSTLLTILATTLMMAFFATACRTAPAPDGIAGGSEVESTEPEDALVEGEDAEHADDQGHGEGVAWHDGDIESAFALASESGKPIFLYWGAEWCPPCYYLKTKVFVKPEFIAKSQDFVNVYLDGDTERAQILGEELGVAGYPTVIVFDPAGQEIMRLPNDIPVERFTEVLDSAVAMMRPVADILTDVRAGGAANATPEDLQMLAYYSWGQDELVELPDEERYDLFKTLYEETPDAQGITKSRFFTEFMNAAIDREDEYDDAAEEASEESGTTVEPEAVFTAEETAAYGSEVARVLQDSDLRDANLAYVLYWSRETVELLHPEASPERDALIALWDATEQAVENDEGQTLDDRLTALYPRLELARIAVDEEEAALEAAAEAAGETAEEGDEAEAEEGAEEAMDEGPSLPVELVEHVRERVSWARQQPMIEGEAQTVLSTLAWLLGEIDADDEAEALLTEAMSDSHAPYYYMSWVGSLKKGADKPEEALEWYRMAYDNATGNYTRFRWGSTYLRTRIDLAPEDVATLEAESVEIITELLTHDDAFSLGNLSRLRQYESKLVGWNEETEFANQDMVDRIAELVHMSCIRYATPEELTISSLQEPNAGDETDAGGEPEDGEDTEGEEAEPPDTQFTRCLDFLAPEDEDETTS